MSRNKMCVWFAVLGFAAVCGFFVGCKGLAIRPTAAPSDVLGPYELDSDGFITDWLVVGPFPNPGDRPDNKGFHVDYLKNYGGEANYVPVNGNEVAKDDKTIVKWAQYQSRHYSRINFFSIDHLGLGYNEEDILVYAGCLLECENDMQLELKIGSDDGYKLWLDHKLIGQQHIYRAAYQDQETYPVKLLKGTHIVLIKVDQDYGSFEFMMRVVTPDGKRATGIKVWN
ncbi:MAG: hypothetical protein JSV82_04855 [Planctomycetota bacterium]|nr:MAG: hypothetical protein JSV82_04855 [Planctomycetota bacterium]